jgi:septin family protein
LQIAGAQGSGKTSLLRLLLETAEISPTATPEQRHAIDAFVRGAPKRTTEVHCVRVEICESKYDRLMLSVIDTPGLDFHDGLALERQVSSIVKYMETQFADTLSEVSCLLHSLTILIAINAWVAWDMLGI